MMNKGRRTLAGLSRKQPLFGRIYHFCQRPSSIVKRNEGIPIQFFFLVLLVQLFWWFYDSTVMSQIKYRPPRVYPKPTESDPLTPFYKDIYNGPARVFSYENHFPCGKLIPESKLDKFFPNEGFKEGFFYIPERMADTKALAGMTVRIARMQANNDNYNSTGLSCTARLTPMRARKFKRRLRDKSFMWSIIREPTERLVRQFYRVAVGLHKKSPTDFSAFVRFVQDNEALEYGYYFKSLGMRSSINTYRSDLYNTYTEEILQGFDFLGVSDRLGESLAVLQLMLGLKTTDMLYLQDLSDHELAPSYQGQECIKTHQNTDQQQITTEMKEWFYTEEFESYVDADVLVYQAANKSLELTIEKLGREKVDKTARRLKWAQAFAQKTCQNTVKFPCSSEGVLQIPNDCSVSNMACGNQCLDEVAKELAKNSEFQKLPTA